MKIKKKLRHLIELMSNVMEAFSAVIFIDDGAGILRLYDYHSFSKEIDKDCQIKEGEGLVGWVKRENKNVLAKHYERSTTTLKFYKKDEQIKSLLAVPLPDSLGVLYVDSKKSYLFTEKKEKIFKQISHLVYQTIKDDLLLSKLDFYKKTVYLYEKIGRINTLKKIKEDHLNSVLESIAEVFNLKAVFYTVKRKYSYTFIFNESTADFILKKYDSNYYKQKGFLGWCIKSNKNLLKNNISSNKKSFIINEEEEYKEYTNFLGIPFTDKDNNLGCVGFVKIQQKTSSFIKTDLWDEEEVEILKNVIDKIGFIK